MKKNAIAVLIGGLVFASAMNIANAADGTIHFTGTISDSTCKVDDTATDANVDLGTVSSSAFAQVGDKASPTAFKITLKDCPAEVTTASVKFDGTVDPNNHDLLKLDSGSTATGVGIELADANGTAVPVATASMAYPLTATAANQLDFTARYVSTAAKVTAGSANSTSEFTINYK